MDKVKFKRDADQARYSQRRKEIETRILKNLEMAKHREEKRKTDFFEKKDYHERLRAQALAEQHKQRERKNRESFMMEQKRQLALQAVREHEDNVREMTLQKFDNDAKFVEQLNEVRGKEHAIMKERENLKKQLKQENVERIRRINEYKRLETLRKINEGDRRTDEMMKRKEEIITQRRLAGLKTKMQKDQIMEVLESSRANGSRAIKMLTQVLSTDSDMAKSGKKKKKKKKKGGSPQRSTSAGDGMGGSMEASETLGPPPDAPSLQARLAQTTDDQQMPYVSPYDDEMMPKGETVTF